MAVLRSVAKTDTLERQRQIINTIANDLFELTGGSGSSSFSNLKLADGTKEAPSLAFASESRTGIYKADNKLTFVNTAKKIFDIDNTSINSLRDINLFKSEITGTTVDTRGVDYYPGTYTEVPLTGGSGDGAVATIVVSDFNVALTTPGAGYNNGNIAARFVNAATQSFVVSLNETVPADPATFSPPEYEYLVDGVNQNLNLTRGNTYTFDISQNSGPVNSASEVTGADAARTAGSYPNVAATGGSGTNATFDITIDGTGAVSVLTINTAGSNYVNAEDLTVPAASVGGTGSDLTISVGVVGMSSQPFHFEVDNDTYLNPDIVAVEQFGLFGEVGSFIQLVIKPTFPTTSVINIVRDADQAIVDEFDCQILTGTAGSYGSGAVLTATVTNNAVSALDISNYGSGYQVGDVLGISSADIIAGAAGTITTPFSGTIDGEGVITTTSITSVGNGYEPNDILGVLQSELPLRSFWQLYLVDHFLLEFDNVQSSYYFPVGTSPTYGTVTPLIKRQINAPAEDSGVATFTISSQGTSHLPGTYTAVSQTSTSGNGYQFVATVTASGGGALSVSDIQIVNPGIDYVATDTITFVGPNIGSNVGPVKGFTDTSAADTNRTPSINTGVTGTSSGTGAGATFDVNVSADGTAVITLTAEGSGYTTGDVITLPVSSTGGTGTAFTLQVTAFIDLELTVATTQNVTPISAVVVSNEGGTVPFALATALESTVDNLVQPIIDTLTESKQYYLNDGNFPTYTLSVGEDGASTNFVITGADSTTTHSSANDPTIVVDKGDKLVFNVNTGTHPFFIQTSAFDTTTYDQANNVSTVENNGATSGVITFDTALVTAGTYYYVCSNHPAAMYGTITVNAEDNDTFLESININTNRRYYFDLSHASNTGYDFVFKATDAATGRLEAEYITYDHANDRVILQPDSTTPTTLYFSAEVSGSIPSPDNINGFPGDPYTINITGSENFSGTGYELRVNTTTKTETVNIEVDTGAITADASVTTGAVSATTGVFTSQLTADLIDIQDATVEVSGNNNLEINTSSLNDIILDTRQLTVGNFNLLGTGEVTTSENITVNDSDVLLNGSTARLNVNSNLFLQGNTISTGTNIDLLFAPQGSSIAKFDIVSGLTIPAGSTLDRPNTIQRENGTIRFNTDTNQYEGYVEQTTSWSSLGGIRDQDGNTYILAEASPGANDNTLYFYNNNVNTLRLTQNQLQFWEMKDISSPNTSAVSFTVWAENVPVTAGAYIAYRNNIYQVASGGTTDSLLNPPTHTSGTQANGTADFTWHSLAVDNLNFDGVNNVRIGPNGDVPLTISEEIRILGSDISTLVNDLTITPFTGKKVKIDSVTTLVVPSGTTLERGIPEQGSIRYNTDDTQYEGYDGTQWGGLGGVKDVDQDTLIKAESVAGADEDVLYFQNNGLSTIQISDSNFLFNGIDTVDSTSLALTLNVNTLNVDGTNVVLTSDGTTTKLTTSADSLEFAISTGLNADTLLKMNDQGELLYNNNFGTGSPNFITLFNSDLNEFGLRDVSITSSDIQLVKGTTDFLPISVYSPASNYGAKVVLSAENTTNDDREIIEFTITHKGSDIFHTEYGNILTGDNLFTTAFTIDGATGDIILTPTLTSDVSANDVVNITAVITQLTK